MKSHITWALVGASVVALGFSSVAATGAAWRASAPASSGSTLDAGRLDISAGTTGESAYVLSDFGMGNMSAGSSIAKPLEIFNSGNVRMGYTIASVTLSPVAPATAPPPLMLAVGGVSSATACTTQVPGDIYSGQMNGASTTEERVVEPGGSEFLCLVASLGSGAQAGQAGEADFTFRALVDR